MVGLQTLDLAIGVRVPASQPTIFKSRAGGHVAARFALPSIGREASEPLLATRELPASSAGAAQGE